MTTTNNNNTVENNNTVATVMNSIKVSFLQDDTVFSETIELANDDKINIVLGTVLNRLFELNATLRTAGATYFKASKPTNIRIETEHNVIDTCKLKECFTAKFKFGQNAKSKKSFCKRVNAVVKFAIAPAKVMSVDNLTTLLEQEIQAVE